MNRRTSIVILGLVVLLVFGLTDPFDWLMPTQFQMTLLVVAVVGYALLVGLVFREKPRDEREESVLHQSSRWGFLVGTAALLLGVVVETLQHNLDAWLVWTLALMVVAKMMGLTRFYD